MSTSAHGCELAPGALIELITDHGCRPTHTPSTMLSCLAKRRCGVSSVAGSLAASTFWLVSTICSQRRSDALRLTGAKHSSSVKRSSSPGIEYAVAAMPPPSDSLPYPEGGGRDEEDRFGSRNTSERFEHASRARFRRRRRQQAGAGVAVGRDRERARQAQRGEL